MLPYTTHMQQNVSQTLSQTFTQAFARLNPNQRAAVEQTDGPLLVIAGPGTGKTQLLSARVAYILQTTDTLSQNILCLTFTESGATNMRERLTRFIGQAAYDVTIGTYHAFGGDLIRRFPQYFGEHKEQSPIDGLGQREIVQAIVDEMAFRNPLKSSQHHLHDLMSTISEVKRGLLSEDDLRAIAQDNLVFLEEVNHVAKEIFMDFTRMPSKAETALPFFENLLRFMAERDQNDYTIGNNIRPLANVVRYELAQAIAEATSKGQDTTANTKGKMSTKPLTAWKNKWLVKDVDNGFMFDNKRESERIAALADVMEEYTNIMTERGLYDFDDMILRSIKALENHQDLRYTLHEQYQYIMLDEFQDTNAAQLKLIKLLTDNPASERRPNVMAVGDDDQAIYAFQGAEVSNMLDFRNNYRDTTIINLTDNYRSHPEILQVAHAVAQQIGTRLESSFEDMSKILVAANHDIAPQAYIDRHEFTADVGQYAWIAEQIAELVKRGVKAQEIAVLAPRHKQLEPLVPFLNALEIPVRYEKRENIIEAPVVQQLLTMSKLILALQAGQDSLADSLWPEVLSYNFWELPTSAIWQLSWKVRAESGLSWSQAVLDEPTFRLPGLLILTLAKQAASETMEVMLDRIIGNELVITHETDLPTVRSPLREFYMGADAQSAGDVRPDLFYQTYSHLTCLRERLRDHQKAQDKALTLASLISFVQLYQDAGERMLNTSPYNQHAEAVQLMTVFKAKGLEFEHVFLPSLQDDVWGDSSRSQSNRLTLPPNMAPIRPAGTSADERLRIFFVAVTRAKLGLHLTSYLQTYSGRNTKRLKYLNEQDTGEGGFKTLILPAERQDVKRINHEVPELGTLELNWRQRHYESLSNTSLGEMLAHRLDDYQLSPTHLVTFTDLIYAGPQTFFFNYILNFPHASGPDADYGTSIHETLQWIQQQVDKNNLMPGRKATLDYYEARLRQKRLLPTVHTQFLERGKYSLEHYLTSRGKSIFKQGNKAEYSFRHENVRIGDPSQKEGLVWLGGKIDLMHINHQSKTICVIDYKTGKTFDRWTSDPKLHKFKHQLICYKLLIENSRSYKGYKVESGLIEFVEPDDNGRIHSLELKFNDADVEQVIQLLQSVWTSVKALDFPDVSGYDASLTGIKQFEADLTNKVL